MPKIGSVAVAPTPIPATVPDPAPAPAEPTTAPLPEPTAPRIKAIQGDSMKLIPAWADNSFDVLCSDPPYGIPVIWEGKAGWPIGDSDMDATVELVRWIAAESARVVVETGYLYLTAGISIYPHAVLAAQKAGWKIRPWTWIKPNPRPLGPGFPWRNNLELVVFGYRKQGGRDYHGGINAFVKTDDPTELEPKDNYLEAKPPLGKQRFHPNQKPVSLFETWLRQTPGRVLDPFMGSGPALVAAQRCGLDAVGIDNGTRESDGKPWAEIAQYRVDTDHKEHWA